MKLVMTYRRASTLLLILIVAVNSYIIAAPFLPMVHSYRQQPTVDEVADLNNRLVEPISRSTQDSSTTPTLIIPKLGMAESVHSAAYGGRYTALNKGVWYDSKTANPGRGNTVLAGHRFTYTDPSGVFYNLHKVDRGDTIGLLWSGKQYVYKVDDIKTVKPNDTSVTAQSDKPVLTLYTCTPVWKPTERLVIVASLQEPIE